MNTRKVDVAVVGAGIAGLAHAYVATIVDSHEYGLEVNIFDDPAVNGMILDYAKAYLRAPTLAIAEQWHGVYAEHPQQPYLMLAPANGVRVVTVTSGLGMSMSFGLAEQTFGEMGVAA